LLGPESSAAKVRFHFVVCVLSHHRTLDIDYYFLSGFFYAAEYYNCSKHSS
jgi:hypothetical protein